MKWAGLETPKCVTVHQRVNVLLVAYTSTCILFYTKAPIVQTRSLPNSHQIGHNTFIEQSMN